jgi:ABC-type dipeptide/oligopeptide/nickel transport system permease component
VDQLLGSLPAIIAVLFVIGVLAYGGIRIGPRFLIRRLAGLVFVLLGVTFVTFILGYLSPGSPVELLCQSKCTAPIIAQLNHLYHLDLPWYEQYGAFLNNLLHFDLGLSFTQRGRHVWDILGSGVPISAQLGLSALVFQVLIGVPIGIIAAVRAGSKVDTASMTFALVLFAIPTFISIPFYQLIMVQLSLHNLPYLPVSGWEGLFDVHAVGPVLLLTLLGLGFYARLTRSTMLEVLGQDYVRTARAKGLQERVVIVRHAFRNAMVPLVTALGPAIAFVVGGAFFTETLFQIPGIGNIAVTSITNKDMPTVQGTVIIVAVSVAIMNLGVDLVYGILDPRIKVS